MLWMIFGAMLLAGALTIGWPLYRHAQRFTPAIALGVLAIVAITAGVYGTIGSPTAQTGQSAMPSVEEMVATLETRLQENPADVAGWKMLGRSNIQLQRYDAAVAAFEQALAREDGQNGQTLADLAEAVLLANGDGVSGRAAELFEAALAASPNNPKALFYGGIAAIERGEPLVAADRWDALLALAPPPEVQDILRRRIAEWRGEPPAAAEDAEPSAPGDAELSVRVTLADAARAALADSTTVFVIARDPAQPTPPIAAVRRQVGDLPGTVTLSNADAMIPGRVLSQFDELEIVVRASLSGQPVASSGDWYGSARITTGESNSVSVAIDQQVP